MKTVKIYTLSHPITNEIKYVGKTEISLLKRLYYHIWDIKRTKNKHKLHWFKNLTSQKLIPKIELLDEVTIDEWRFWEQYWISQIKSWGFNLINITDGGEGYSSYQLKLLWATKEYREHHTKRMTGKNNPSYGKKVSNKTKKILREKCPRYGKQNGNFGKEKSITYKEKNRLSQPTLKTIIRKDINDNYIDEWIGIKNMCRNLNLDDGAVVRVLKGKCRQHKNFKFEYKHSE